MFILWEPTGAEPGKGKGTFLKAFLADTFRPFSQLFKNVPLAFPSQDYPVVPGPEGHRFDNTRQIE